MRTNAKVRSALATTDTPLVTVTEAVAAVVGNVSNQSPDGVVRFLGQVAVTGGTNTTAMTLRVRRGNGITGTLVGEAETVLLTGATTGMASIQVEDSPGEVGGVPYSLTVQLVAASANGAVSTASLMSIS